MVQDVILNVMLHDFIKNQIILNTDYCFLLEPLIYSCVLDHCHAAWSNLCLCIIDKKCGLVIIITGRLGHILEANHAEIQII